jgi:AcrR family transcriptional regulator
MPVGEKAPRRVRDSETADVRTALLDAAESIVREEGYGAATARRIASRVGLKHQVVFYYFGTQDDLLLALFRRQAETHRERLLAALDSAEPLRALWELISDRSAMKLTLEFLALANHSEAMREAIAANAEAVRSLQVEALARHMRARGIETRLSPGLVTILTNALARLLVQEATIGITAGHAEVEALIEAVLQQFAGEGDLPTPPGLASHPSPAD